MGQGELKMVTYPFKKVKAEYDNIAAVTTKNKFLRNQFSIRFHGYDWTEYQTAYSKDGEPRADAKILKELEELMKRETRVPPTEPPVHSPCTPHFGSRGGVSGSTSFWPLPGVFENFFGF